MTLVILHRQRKLAESFGSDPYLYDRARPGYPRELVDDLLSSRVKQVLDVGCGTGIASVQLINRGCQIVGVDPDPRMASLAFERGVDVEISKFESWRASRQSDLVICGHAWHWIDPQVGPWRAATALREGGRLCVFWNTTAFPHAIRGEIVDIYNEIAPQFAEYSVLLNADGGRKIDVMEGIAECSLLSEPRHRVWNWTRHYGADEWIEHLLTHSDHRALPRDRKRRLFRAFRKAIRKIGGIAEMEFETHLVSAARRGKSAGEVGSRTPERR